MTPQETITHNLLHLEFDFPITVDQRHALLIKYMKNADGATSFEEFCKKASPARDYIALAWCSMYIGIEKDGYTHS